MSSLVLTGKRKIEKQPSMIRRAASGMYNVALKRSTTAMSLCSLQQRRAVVDIPSQEPRKETFKMPRDPEVLYPAIALTALVIGYAVAWRAITIEDDSSNRNATPTKIAVNDDADHYAPDNSR